MQDFQASLERIKEKQEFLRRLKLENSLKEHSQEEFEHYIETLPFGQTCRYQSGIPEMINLCNNRNFHCKFKGEYYKSFTKTPKKECKREEMMKFIKILEH